MIPVHKFIMTPPPRSETQKKFTLTGMYPLSLTPPDISFLKEHAIPVWAMSIGTEEKTPITIIFSHGNSTDVPRCAENIFKFFEPLESSYYVTLIMWDYPGYSFSPLDTTEYTLMEQQLKTLISRVYTEDKNIFIVGHSLGASLQSCVLADESISRLIKGAYFMAPFLSLHDMCNKRFSSFGSILTSLFHEKLQLFNFEANLHQAKILENSPPRRCAIFDQDLIVHSLANFSKIKNAFESAEDVIVFQGGHNSLAETPRIRTALIDDIALFIASCLLPADV